MSKLFFQKVSNRLFVVIVTILLFTYFAFSLLQTQKEHELIVKQEVVDVYKLALKIARQHAFESYFVENELYETSEELVNEYKRVTPIAMENHSKEHQFSLSIEHFTIYTLPSELVPKLELLKENPYTLAIEAGEWSLFGKLDEKRFLRIKKSAKDYNYINSQFEKFLYFMGVFFLLSMGVLYMGYRELMLHQKKKDIMEREYQYLREDAKRLAFIDTLTGVATRLKLTQSLQDLLENSKRFMQPFSLILFDIDFFKKINDGYGHDYGDVVLREIGKHVKGYLRDSDIVARWGGEEFVIVLPMTSLASAKKVAEDIRVSIANLPFDKIPRVTCSFGVVQYQLDDTEESLIKRADNLLYEAKESGRNCVKCERR